MHYGGRFGEGFFGGLVVGFGFFGEVGGDEELGDLLFLCGEGAEIGDALKLLGS